MDSPPVKTDAPSKGTSGPQYFASFENEDFGAAVLSRIQEADSSALTSPIRALLHKARLYYYGFDLDGYHGASAIVRDGEVGELAKYRVNHARNLVNTLLNLVVSDRVAWVPKATNIDYASMRQVEVAKAVLEYYWTDRGVERLVRLACEKALFETEGFVMGLWDEFSGEAVDGQAIEGAQPDTLAPARSGDFTFELVSTDDVIRDSTKRSWDALEWVAVRAYRNKFSLAAQYPTSAEDIFNAPEDEKKAKDRSPRRNITPDDIPVYYFFHKPTPAMPHGREALILTSGELLRDGALTYDDLPLHRIVPGELHRTPYAYTPFYEILSIQELIDSLHSSAATNLLSFGTQNVFMPQGAGVETDQIAGGMRIIQGGPNGEKPEALQLCATPGELYTHLQQLKHDEELLFGVSALVRGQVESDKLSGSALALLESQVKKQASGLNGSYQAAVQSLGTALITEMRKRAKAERTINIVGKDNAFLVQEEKFTGESFGSIKRVTVDLGNPLSQSVFGRMEMAKELHQMGLINNLEQFFMLLDTGRAEPLTQALDHELMLIRAENEDIASGVCPPVMLHDNHLLHGREHRGPVASPQSRKDPKVLQADIDHIHKHYEAYYGVPPMQPQVDPMTGQPTPGPDGQPAMMPEPMYRPRMLALMGLAPPDPSLGGMPGGPGGGPPPGGPGGPPPPQNGGGGSKPGPAPSVPDQNQNTPGDKGTEPGPAPKQAQMPQQPVNPSTGQRAPGNSQ